MITNIVTLVLIFVAVGLLAKAFAWGAGSDQTSVHKGSKRRATEQLRRTHHLYGTPGYRYSLNDRQLRRKFRDEYRTYYDAECKAQGF